MKGKVEMLYPIFITMSAFLSVTWADGTTMVTEQTTMVTDDGTDGFTAESTVSTLWQETTEEIITTDETTPEVGGIIETIETVYTTDETIPDICRRYVTIKTVNTKDERMPEIGRHNKTIEINTTDETLPEIGRHNATIEKVNTTDGRMPEIGGHNETTEEINTTDETLPEIVEPIETIDEVNTTDETLPEIGGPNETTEKVNPRDETLPEIVEPIAIIEKVNPRDETLPEIGGLIISCYVCSSTTTSEDDECYVKQGNQSDKADCDKSCLITHIQREDSKELINVIRLCGQCTNNSWEYWECIIIRDIEICTYCCDSDGCNDHMGNGANILMQPNFILTVSATVTGMYLAA